MLLENEALILAPLDPRATLVVGQHRRRGKHRVAALVILQQRDHVGLQVRTGIAGSSSVRMATGRHHGMGRRARNNALRLRRRAAAALFRPIRAAALAGASRCFRGMLVVFPKFVRLL